MVLRDSRHEDVCLALEVQVLQTRQYILRRDRDIIAANSAIDPDGGIDTLPSIEWIWGSEYDDYILDGSSWIAPCSVVRRQLCSGERLLWRPPRNCESS